MSRGYVYMNAGARHGIHLIVSLMSLRDFWDGPVAIACEEDGPGRDVAEWCAKDAALQPIKVCPDKRMVGGGRGVSYFGKTILPQITPFNETIFLDADTLIVGNMSPMWPDPKSGEFVLTQFADWQSTGGKMRQRILGWNEVPSERGRVERMLEKPWPAVNTGVMAWSKASKAFCDDWTTTCAKRIKFMADETCAQIIFPDHPYRMMSDRYNASVVFPCKGETVDDRDDIRCYHGHGFKFWKRPYGRKVWLPSYFKALARNRGNIQALKPMGKMFSYLSADEKAHVNQYLLPA